MGAMFNDKRIDELRNQIAERDDQIKRQAQIILDKNQEIKKLEAEIGIMERSILIAYDRLSRATAKKGGK